MLDAAVPGPVFTSPTPDPILAATKAVDGGAGVLHIVKNYTGDVLNFETAADLAEADGITVRSVIINDDVAVKDSLYTAGRRGVAGTVLVEKIAGAAAERGDDLDAVATIAEKVNGQVRSMGVALTPCTVPHAGEPSFTLADDEIEIGIGIHGEPGRERIKIEPADAIVDRLLEPILTDLPFESGDEVLLFVNGMGGTPQVELYIAFRRAAEVLAEKGITVTRTLVGQLRDLAGDAGHLDLRAEARRRTDRAVGRAGADRCPALGTVTVTLGGAWAKDWVTRSAAVIAEHRVELINLDREIGDGDHGENMNRGYTAVMVKLADLPAEATPSEVLKLVATTLISTVGGASGPLVGTAYLKGAGAIAGRGRAGRRCARRHADRGAGRRRDARQGRVRRQDDDRRVDTCRRGGGARSGERGIRDRDPPRGGRGGRGRGCCDRTSRGAQGSCQLPRRACHRASRPGRPVEFAAAQGSRRCGGGMTDVTGGSGS